MVDARKGIQSLKNVAPNLFMMAQLKRGMVHQRSKSQDVRTATWNVSSMVSRSDEVVMLYTEDRLISVVMKRRGGRVKCGDAWC